ncbi:7915_t:CDS:2, partial [Dentiscutata erythropus]
AKEFDKLQWSLAYTYERTSISETYQDKSPLQRTTEAIKKSSKLYNIIYFQIANESVNIEKQERFLRIEEEKLAIQKNKNNELEKEIML